MRFRNTIIMAVVLAVLGGFVYFWEVRGRDAREEAEREAARLLSFETEQVSRLTLEGEEGPLTLERADDGWRIVEPHAIGADDSAVDSLVSALESAEQERLVVENADELAPFGLEEPEVRATVELQDGSRMSLDIGRGTPVGYNVYVRRGDERDVYMAPASIKDRLGKSLFDLRDKRIVTFEQADVARLELQRDELALEVRKRDARPGDAGWEIVAPLQARADEENVESALRRLGTDRASAFVAEAPSREELASYGLSEPAIVVTVWNAEDASQTLEIGDEATDPAGYYARRRGAGAVFVVPSAMVSALPDSIDDVRNRDVVDVERERIAALELDVEGTGYRLEKSGTQWHISEPRDIEADASAVSTLITAALNLRARGFAPGGAGESDYRLDAPQLEMALYLTPQAGASRDDEPDPADPAAAATASEPEIVRLRVGAATEVADEAAAAEEGDEPQTVAARYVTTSGDPTVYLVAEDDLDDLRVDLLRLRAKTLVSFAQADLTRIEVESGGTTYAVDKSGETWRRAEPQSGELDETAVTDLLWDLNYLRLEDVAAEWDTPGEAPGLATYGLEPPTHRVRAWIGDQQVADVRLGAAVPESELEDRPQTAAAEQVYAMAGDRQAIFQVARRLRDSVEELVAELAEQD